MSNTIDNNHQCELKRVLQTKIKSNLTVFTI